LQDNNMSRIAIAFRAFFAALFSQAVADRIRAALESPALPKADAVAKKQPEPVGPASRRPHDTEASATDDRHKPEAQAKDRPPARSEAVTLLAALQREARFVDLVKQPLGGFSDDQIGAAARNVLSDCATVLDRFFALQPLVDQLEDSPCDVPPSYDAACYKLTGRVEGPGPFHGNLIHHGWKATITKLPAWTGPKDSALVIAPAEVEIQ
jgi:hypothetical protein